MSAIRAMLVKVIVDFMVTLLGSVWSVSDGWFPSILDWHLSLDM
jgi:hypothetical protein